MRRYLSRLIVVFLCVVVYTLSFVKPAYSFEFFGGSVESIIKTNTSNYWDKLHTIQSSFSYEKSDSKDANELEFAKKFSETSNRIVNEITKLPMNNVDEDVLLFSSSLVQLFSQGASVFENLVSLKGDIDSQGDFMHMIYAFSRGFFGDFTVVSDAFNQINKNSTNTSKLQSQFDNWRNKSSEISINEQKLRITLSRRYNKEFPKLDNLI